MSKTSTAAPVADPNKFNYSFKEFRALGGPCGTMAYALHKKGALTFVKIGRSTRIDGDSAREYLRSLPEARP